MTSHLFETVMSITLGLKINKKCCPIYQNVLKETQQFLLIKLIVTTLQKALKIKVILINFNINENNT